MYISSTKRVPQKNLDLTTPVGRLDRQLSDGEIPEDLYIVPGSRPSVVEADPGNGLSVNHRCRTVKEARKRVLVSTVILAPVMATPGALLGTMAFPGMPLVGAAVGAGVGVAMALDTAREFKGSVTITSGQEVNRRTWYGEPENFTRTPQELRTILHATGVLGDRVELVPFNPEGPRLPGRAEQLAEHRETLKSLASERRLLADLGGKTRYGKPALQLVEPNQARELLSRGKPVHVIDVIEAAMKEHRLTTEANSGTHHKKSLRSYGYTEQRIAYALQKIERPEDLGELKQGKGLPDSMVGVPAEENSFSQNVFQQQESAGRTINANQDNSYRQLEEVLSGSAPVAGTGGRFGSALSSMVHPSTRGYAITGAVLGTVAAAALGGVEPSVGMTLGGFAGHFVGRQAVARTSEGREMGTLASNLVTGLGAAAGLGIGVMAAFAAPQHAVVACGAIGMLGGMSSGVLLGRGKSEVGKIIAMGAASVGGLAGIGLAVMGGGTAASVVVGALGAVAGGCLAKVATRGK